MEQKQLSPAQVVWFRNQSTLNNSRLIASNLLDALIYKRTGLGLSDLPDTIIICDALDTLEEIVSKGTLEAYNEALNEATYYVSEIVDTIMD